MDLAPPDPEPEPEPEPELQPLRSRALTATRLYNNDSDPDEDLARGLAQDCGWFCCFRFDFKTQLELYRLGNLPKL